MISIRNIFQSRNEQLSGSTGLRIKLTRVRNHVIHCRLKQKKECTNTRNKYILHDIKQTAANMI